MAYSFCTRGKGGEYDGESWQARFVVVGGVSFVSVGGVIITRVTTTIDELRVQSRI